MVEGRFLTPVGASRQYSRHHHSAMVTPNNYSYSLPIDSVYTVTIESYCVDDNAYWPKEIERIALACPIDARKLHLTPPL